VWRDFGVLLGFCEKRVAERGFLMVNSWWKAGESWHVKGRFSGSKIMPSTLDLFLGDSRFGNGWARHADSVFRETRLSLRTAV
jgi:hypothetical protein